MTDRAMWGMPLRFRFAVAVVLAGLMAAVQPARIAAQDRAGARNAALLALLVAAYPDHLAGAENNALIWKDGIRMPFDDGRGAKPLAVMLERPDLEDMFAVRYPLGRSGLPPDADSDPGRVRFEPLFRKMYGDCASGAAERHLADVIWLRSKGGGQRLRVTRVNGVADKLQAVSDELDKLPESFLKYLKPSEGGYNCRPVAGTARMSPHGYGIAIDIATAHADYWHWTRPGADGRTAYRNRVPWEIVEVFEKHGFIWGGKWYHYDTMHFEYRPEIIAAARLPGQ